MHGLKFRTLLMFTMLCGVPALADEAREAKEEIKTLWAIDSMMEQAADNIARRYNLNEDQRAFTQEMLTARVTDFLDTHDNIWPLIRDLARYQYQGEGPKGDAARRMGEVALPMLAEVKEAILSAQDEWRATLSEEQKKMHDWDLKEMEQTFSQMERNFNRMAQGASAKAELFPTQTPKADEPPRPKVPQKGLPGIADSARVQHQEEWWDTYVQDFIRKYGLDDAQSEAALSILRECKQKARHYRKSKESEFAKAETELKNAKQATDPKIKRAKIRLWTQIQKSLNKPIVDLFQELKSRLERIPTEAQRKRVDPEGARRKREPVAAPTKPSDATEAPAATETPASSETAAPVAPDAAKPNETGGGEKPN